MHDISLRRVKSLGELSQSHLGQSITKCGYVFSVSHNAISQYVLFREEAVELG